jgi:hypothetical protein
VRLRSGQRQAGVSLSRKQFRYGFGNALSEQESNDLFDPLDRSVTRKAAV